MVGLRRTSPAIFDHPEPRGSGYFIGYRLCAGSAFARSALVAAYENMLATPNGPVAATMVPPSVTVYSPVTMIPVVIGMWERGPGQMWMRKVWMGGSVNLRRGRRLWRGAQSGT